MATWDRYKSEVTGLEIEVYSGKTFVSRSYCDDPDIGVLAVYLTKAPICKLELDPVTQYLGEAIAWDISNSRSATSTIDEFNIDWGGDTDIGDLTNQDWNTDPKTGNVTYDAVGEYTVTATVTDVLGKTSKECILTVNIVEVEDTCYVGTLDGGCYIKTPSALSQENTGLSAGHLNFRSLRLHPEYKDLSATQRHLWAATEDGLAFSFDGADSWSVVDKDDLGTPTNTAGDDPAPVTNDLDQIDLCFCPQDKNRVYLFRDTGTRAWVYVSDDYGETWNNVQIGI